MPPCLRLSRARLSNHLIPVKVSYTVVSKHSARRAFPNHCGLLPYRYSYWAGTILYSVHFIDRARDNLTRCLGPRLLVPLLAILIRQHTGDASGTQRSQT
jgi:hypothetical protein